MSEKIDYTKLDLVKLMNETVVSEDVLKDASNLVKENASESLKGRDSWSEDTKLKFSMLEIERLEKKLEAFEKLCEDIRLKAETKIENMRANWKIEDSIVELAALKKAVKNTLMEGL